MLVDQIESGLFSNDQDFKLRGRTIVSYFRWDPHDANKIWSFQPEKGGNVLVDTSQAVDYLNEEKDSLISSF